MQSEQQHIDDFFRSKEEAWNPGNNRQEAHWQQMQKQLARPAEVSPVKGSHIRTTRRLLSYMAGLAVITVVTIFIVTSAPDKTPAPGLSTTPAEVLPDKTVTQKNNTITVTPKKQESTATTRKPTRKLAPQKSGKPVAKNKKSAPANRAAIGVPVHKKIKADQPVNTPQQPDAASLLQAFYAQLEKEGEIFIIRPGRDTTLVAQEGTRLIIPSNTFITKSGTRKPGTVRIVLKEYYSYEDILSAKLSTTSNGQQLVTGGMIHLTAESDGEEVVVAPGKSITVEMPTDNYDQRMQLFTGSEPLQKFALFTELFAQETELDTIPLQKLYFNNNKTVRDSVPLQKFKFDNNKTVHDSVPFKKFDYNNNIKTERDSVLFQKSVLFDKNTLDKQMPYDTRMGDTLIGGLQQPVNYTGINWQPAGQEQWLPLRSLGRTVMVPDIAGEPYKVHYGKKGITARFLVSANLKQSDEFIKNRLKRYSHFYDKIKIRRLLFGSKPLFGNKDISVIKGDSIPMPFNSALRLKLISAEDSARYMNRLWEDSLYNENQKKYLKNYRFTITTMGWYNCDRFLKENRPLVEFALNLGEGYEAGNFISQLVFTRFPSVADGYYSGSKFLFRQLPENEKVQLVCVGVKDGKVVSCFQPFTISNIEVSNLQFEDTTPEAFRKKLASLKLVSAELN